MRRLVPNHPLFGYPWVLLPNGFVTFREKGFVAADSPALLLARHNYEVACIRRLLKGREISRSLEVGCGYGRLTPTFSELSAQHIATDINVAALANARQAYPDCDFREASVTNLPFADNYFDLVVTWTVLQHIPPGKIDSACAELRRVLADGGTLIICEETRLADQAFTGRLHAWHRHVSDYQRMLDPLKQIYSSEVIEISRIPGMRSPGRVMVWTR